jgi:ADP-ribose pyrophosphatase YjhB (NUDIX family)
MINKLYINVFNYFVFNMLVFVNANAGCFISKDNHILLVQQTTNVWALPGGLQEYNEQPEKTAIRETLEETGYMVDIYDKIGIENNNFHIFRCSIINDTYNISKKYTLFDKYEIKQIKWIKYEDLNKNLIWRFPNQAKYYETWLIYNNSQK